MKVSGVLKIGHNKIISGGTKREVSNTRPTRLHRQHSTKRKSVNKAAAIFSEVKEVGDEDGHWQEANSDFPHSGPPNSGPANRVQRLGPMRYTRMEIPLSFYSPIDFLPWNF